MEEVIDKVKELTTKLDTGVKEVLTSERFVEYLKQMSKFHDYSFGNTILIMLQKPDATLVAGFKTWQNKFNRNVNKGEKGIKIIAPCPVKINKLKDVVNEKGEKEKKEIEITIPKFKAVTVFDVSQTSGEPLKEIAKELKGEYKNYNILFESIKKCSNFEINFESNIKANGFCKPNESKIVIKEELSEIHKIKTLIHEIAHEKLHSKKENKTEKKPTRNQQEVEAESVAYVVSNYFGIDTSTYSFDYISSWQKKDIAEVKSSLQIIQETSNSLIEQIKNNLELSKELSISDKIKQAKEISENQNEEKKSKTKEKDISLQKGVEI